jgi:hypothetical protein
MGQEVVKVYGLKELNRALKRLDVELPKNLKGRLKVIADHVADLVRARVPHVSGKLASKVRGSATTRGAAVRVNLDYAGPVEFGGYPKGREFVKKGRYIFPAAEAERSRIEEDLIHVLNASIEEAGLNG